MSSTKEILRLFEKRMEVCEDVAEYKIHTGKQVLDPKREQDKLDVLKNQAHGSFNSLGAQELFQQIMAISRKRQYQLLTKNGIDMEKNYEMVDELPLKNVNVVFQGVEGAYSYAAMRAYFPDEINSYHVRTFRAAMEEVAFGKADYAVLPIENSTEGIVTDIYDLLTEYQLYIVGEQGVRVQHVLLDFREFLWRRLIPFILIRRRLHSANIIWRTIRPGKPSKQKIQLLPPRELRRSRREIRLRSQAVRQVNSTGFLFLQKISVIMTRM